jgi:hypothetical protein
MEHVTASRAEARTGSRWPCPSPCAALLLSSPMATPRKPGPVAAAPRAAGSGSPCQARGLSTSSGTDSALITPNDVVSGGVAAFRTQSVRSRARLPDMADRW